MTLNVRDSFNGESRQRFYHWKDSTSGNRPAEDDLVDDGEIFSPSETHLDVAETENDVKYKQGQDDLEPLIFLSSFSDIFSSSLHLAVPCPLLGKAALTLLAYSTISEPLESLKPTFLQGRNAIKARLLTDALLSLFAFTFDFTLCRPIFPFGRHETFLFLLC